MRMEEICRKVIEDAGGPAKLARALGDLTSQAVSQWKRIPIERVAAVEALSGVSRHELRPDIFGPAPSEQGAAA